ncbi:hypothetical protein FRC08_014976, partial [Ceratobasidium sp. 394]
MYAGARALEAHKTTSTEVDIGPTRAPSVPPQELLDEARVVDLELQLRNVRKLNDEASRDIKILTTFRATIEDAFCHMNSDDPNFPDSMTLLAKLRDITPRLVAVASVDIDAIASRIESAQQRAIALEAIQKQNKSTIAELKERVRELEEGKSAVGDLEAIVRQLQSRLNTYLHSTQNGATEDSGTERIHTLIRGPSYDGATLASSSQTRPLASLSVPAENGRLFSQDQNQGRAASISRGSRSTRPPLAEKEGARVGQPDVEVETTDPRRSIRRLVESSISSIGNSAPPSRGRSTTPSHREPSSENPTPSQGKGKGRLGRSVATALDTVEEVGDTSAHEQALGSGAPTTATSSLPTQQPSHAKASPVSTPATSKPAEDAEPERHPSPPPTPNPFSSDLPPPRSPAHFLEVGQSNPSGSPPSPVSKSSSRAATNRGSSPMRSLVPSASDSGPIMQLPFKLIASPTKPQETSSLPMSRPAAPTGRVPRAPRNSHQPYGRRFGGSRKTMSDAPKEAASVFSFALPGASSSALSAATEGPAPGAMTSQLDNPAGFVTPERLGNTFNLFPTRFDFGQTPGGLAFKATGRAPPGTPAATTTLFGTEV